METTLEKSKLFVEEIAQEYLSDSIGSLNTLTNAKAIALSNSEVKDRIADVIKHNKKICSVFPSGRYGTKFDYGLIFKFKSTIEQNDSFNSDLDEDMMLIRLELISHSVLRIDYPFRPDVKLDNQFAPITVAVPSTEHIFPKEELNRLTNKDIEFFEKLDIKLEEIGIRNEGDSVSTSSSYWTTYTTSQTSSTKWTTRPGGHGSNETVQDDTNREGKNDSKTDD